MGVLLSASLAILAINTTFIALLPIALEKLINPNNPFYFEKFENRKFILKLCIFNSLYLSGVASIFYTFVFIFGDLDTSNDIRYNWVKLISVGAPALLIVVAATIILEMITKRTH